MSIPFLLAFQALSSIVLFIVPAWIIAYIIGKKMPMKWLHWQLKTPMNWHIALTAAGIMVAAQPLINCLSYWNQQLSLPASMAGLEAKMKQMEDVSAQLLESFMRYSNGNLGWMLLLLIVLAIIPAIGEEMTFRGMLQRIIPNPHVSVWVIAFVFSAVHMQFYGFVPRMLLGAMLGYTLVWTGDLRYSMIAHATNNGMVVLLFFIMEYLFHIPVANYETLGVGDTLWLTLLSIPVTAILIIRLRHLCIQQGCVMKSTRD